MMLLPEINIVDPDETAHYEPSKWIYTFCKDTYFDLQGWKSLREQEISSVK